MKWNVYMTKSCGMCIYFSKAWNTAHPIRVTCFIMLVLLIVILMLSKSSTCSQICVDKEFMFLSTPFQWGTVHIGQPRAGSGVGTRSQVSFWERGHRICSSCWERLQFLQAALHSFVKGWGFASNFGSVSWTILWE